MTILDDIFAYKKQEILLRKAEATPAEMNAAARQAPPAINFSAAIGCRPHPALIAEIKQRSPSRGVLSPNFNPAVLARLYQQNGAAAISVLTDEKYFGGGLHILRRIAAQFANGELPRLPLLCKDFICDAYQMYEARANGADAVLLIAAMLEKGVLRDLHSLALELGVTPLVEVHNVTELETVLECQPRVIGINNRNLHDFSVHMETFTSLRPAVPPGILVVAESGIHNREDVLRLERAGANAILVGEALVTAGDIAAQVRCLAQVEEIR